MCDELDYDDGGNDINRRADHVYVLHDDGWHVIDYFDGDEHDLDELDDRYAAALDRPYLNPDRYAAGECSCGAPYDEHGCAAGH